MSFKKYILAASALILSTITNAQQSFTSTIEPIKNEKWWGLLSGLGTQMPFVEPIKIDLSQTSKLNQSSSTLVSSSGRYIWSASPFEVEINDAGVITITSKHEEVEVQKVGKTLREAFLKLSQKHFSVNSAILQDAIFKMPIITVNETTTSSDLMDLTKALKTKGFKPNIFMFSVSCQRYNGSLEFNQSQFPNPKELIDNIHSIGGKVMVSVSPFVSADAPIYRELKKKGYLLLDSKTQNPKLIEWDRGVSVSYDFTNPEALSYFIEKLSKLKSTYSIDGFNFIEGNLDYYTTGVESFVKTSTAISHVEAWNTIASNFKMSQIKSTFNSQNLALSHRLTAEQCTWESIQTLIPNLMAASLMGYPYISVGTEYINDNTDQTLIVRLTQLQAATPIMNLPLSVATLSDENTNACLKASLLHSKFNNYILELSQETQETGAPIIRTMEYEFPGKAFSDCKDQFMLGSRYLIAPILNVEGKRMVRLPNGRWQDDLGNIYRGPRVLSITASIDRLPYFEYMKNESIVKKILKR